MTVQEYLQELDESISAAPEVVDVEVIRRSIWDTGMEAIGLYRYKLHLSDGSLLELMERLVQEQNSTTITKYRCHWQNEDAKMMKRWDNAPHHQRVRSFPHHLHDGSETNVVSHEAITGLEVLKFVTSQIANQA